MTEYVAQAFVVEPDGDEAELRAALRGDDEDCSGDLIGPAGWTAVALSNEPFFELPLPDGPSGACFVGALDEADKAQRVAIAEAGRRSTQAPARVPAARAARTSRAGSQEIRTVLADGLGEYRFVGLRARSPRSPSPVR